MQNIKVTPVPRGAVGRTVHQVSVIEIQTWAKRLLLVWVVSADCLMAAEDETLGASREGDVPSVSTVDMLGVAMLNAEAPLDTTLNTEPSRETMLDGGLVKEAAAPLPAQIGKEGGLLVLLQGPLGSLRFNSDPHPIKLGRSH